ncbi:MAG: acyl-protein synthetase [Tenericutes bacterium]|jgi:phenylacetate-coenzyme A ligase PaaK-like adenylate-forming protein|nr:acyl-protein synthetase [Mycoplasmatota bacterium]
MGRYTRKLFSRRKIYDLERTNEIFVKAMRENAIFHFEHNADYKRILDEASFNPRDIQSMEDLFQLPFIPTLYYKHHEMFSMSLKRMPIKATSSGTSGMRSKIGMDIKSLWYGFKMVVRTFKYHKLWSLRPVTYIIFGYEPHKSNQAGIAKTANGFTFVAPSRKKVFAIKYTKDGYVVDLERVKQALIEADKKHRPVRTIGFPAYTYFLLKEMKSEGIRLKLHKKSKITIGGGWKQFYAEKVDKESFYALVKEVLGVKDTNCVEFFGAVEHPILYTDCRHHHFHIPVYSRVVIRDIDTLEPLPHGQMGLINLMTPMVKATPLLSVMTDDLGILHNEGCKCGEKSPWLEIIGRVGIKDITTCAAGAEKLLDL